MLCSHGFGAKLIVVLAVIPVITFASTDSLRADITTTRITNNSYEDTFPRIKGNCLVWQHYFDADWEILLYDTVTAETVQITNNSYDDISPQTDGDYVVWLGYIQSVARFSYMT